MVTDFGVNRRKLAYPTKALEFHNGWEDRNIDARVNTADDPSTSVKNLVNFGPSPKFCRRREGYMYAGLHAFLVLKNCSGWLALSARERQPDNCGADHPHRAETTAMDCSEWLTVINIYDRRVKFDGEQS